MRLCVMCVYWTLLLISVVSSALLFLIVATETARARRQDVSSESNGVYATYDNTSLDAAGSNFIEPRGVPTSDMRIPSPFKPSYKEDYREEEPGTSVNFETLTSDKAETDKEIDILAETLTQQPNLSQGISETGQAVVLTLVDTAAAELQSLAEPKIAPEFRARSVSKNASIITNNVIREAEELPDIPPSTQIPSPPVVDETTEKPNDTEALEDEVLLVQKSIVEEVPEVVVVVRAEQKVATDAPDFRIEEDVVPIFQEDVPKVEEVYTPAPELNDTAARAQLVGGTRDEGAAVILDGIVTAGPTDPHEDIPSFSEWAQKRLEEAEKKKTYPNASVQNPGGPGRGVGGMKIRSKNYASPDCGAKIVAANPETQSARSVLASSRDEYMLNTCTSRIWFVVELCEAIQAKKIELANFELFSSTPKDFSVFVSDRFPTREWSPVGQFTAKDVKDIQSFPLHPHLFGKFIKVELHSHYGSEHFCPISLFRAYGTSEFEVLETETENQALTETTPEVDDDEDSDEEELLDVESGGEPPRNLFGSARDAVLSIVKKAAEVLVKSSDLTGNNITEIQQSIDSGNILKNSYATCTTPRYTILCGNCSDQKFAKVFQLVSCCEQELDELLKIGFVNDTLRRSRLCNLHGVEIDALSKKDEGDDTLEIDDVNGTCKARTNFVPEKSLQATFLTSVFKSEYIVALCNVLATKERKVVMNTSNEIQSNSSEDASKEDLLSTSKTTATPHTIEVTGSLHQVPATCASDQNLPGCRSTSSKETRRRTQESHNQEAEDTISTGQVESSPNQENLATQKPRKNLGKEDIKKESIVPVTESSKETIEETMQAEVLTTIPPTTNIPTPSFKIVEEPSTLGSSVESTSQTTPPDRMAAIDIQESTNDSTGLDVDGLEPPQQPKVEKVEQLEQEMKQAKVELGEQEMKLPPQDALNFDSLLSDLKDFEGDTIHLQNGQAASAASTAQPTTSSTPQKESVFLRLSNRIKTLERNMSLSGQYLEELSRRYKKQVEEMQRSLERAVSAMSEESRKGEERDAKRLEEIAALREEITVLSRSVESLIYDRDSWRARLSVVGQHAFLICLEVIIIIFILCYCRKSSDIAIETESETKKAVTRRKSAENFGTTKKTKKRRPSEIASHIRGTYHELMIEEKCHESKKEKKRKRRKEAIISQKSIINTESRREIIDYKNVLDVIPGGTSLPSRRASSIEPPKSHELQVNTLYRRPESAPETNITWSTLPEDHFCKIERIVRLSIEDIETSSEKESTNSQHMEDSSNSRDSHMTVDTAIRSNSKESTAESSKQPPVKSGGILKSAKLSSPSFMKTALGSRKKRKLFSTEEKCESPSSTGGHNNNEASSQPSLSTLEKLSETLGSVNGSATNGLMEDSDESRSSSATPTSGKKEKRSTGLKKMVRKLF